MLRPKAVCVKMKCAIKNSTIKMMIGIGIPKTEPLPINLNASFFTGIGAPFVYTRTHPLNNVIVPKVAINGGMPHCATKNPFARPQIAPMNNATSSASTMLSVVLKIPAPIAPANPTIEPTDRSIPPVKITNVIPQPTIPATVICLITLKKFVKLKKLLDKKDATIQIIAKINTER